MPFRPPSYEDIVNSKYATAIPAATILPQTEARSSTDAPTTITDIERDAIERALAATAGNRRQAAARLGMPLRTFYDKLKRYGIS